MTTFGLVVVGVLMVVGILGVFVPLVPGLMLILGAALWWAISDGGTSVHWWTFAAICVIGALGTTLKYVVPAKRTADAGASKVSLIFAIILGIVGMFVIPIIGAPIGFVLGIYVAELQRHRAPGPAWAATKAAVTGFALAMLIEFTAGVFMFGAWIVGVLAT